MQLHVAITAALSRDAATNATKPSPACHYQPACAIHPSHEHRARECELAPASAAGNDNDAILARTTAEDGQLDLRGEPHLSGLYPGRRGATGRSGRRDWQPGFRADQREGG